jgi:hypothetical protein
MNMVWIAYVIVVLVTALVIGRHLGKFTDAYTEMTGMMAGMTMGMLNGFLLGYGAAAATASMFWGNLFGIFAGLGIGLYYGRPSGLMGIMDGSMGGVMGGSMGAMLAAMLVFPTWAMDVTGVLLVPIYITGMAGLVALIEQSAPEHAARHRVLPVFTRAVAVEAAEVGEEMRRRARQEARKGTALHITDYYELLGVGTRATQDEIGDAYLVKLSAADEAGVGQLEQALAILTEPGRREVYDRRLEESKAALGADARPACCPPKKVKVGEVEKAEAKGTAVVAGRLASAAVVRSAVPETKRASSPATARVSTEAARKTTQKQSGANYASSDVVRTGSRRQDAAGSHSYRQGQSRNGRGHKQESPISWVGIAALVVILAVGGTWFATRGGAGNSGSYAGAYAVPSAAQLEGKATVAQPGTDGRQTLNVVVNGSTMSYSPSVIEVKKGVPVHFNLSVEGRDPGCGRFVGVKGLGVHGIAVPGQVAPMDFTPTESGVFEINCSMNMMQRGYLLVTD